MKKLLFISMLFLTSLACEDPCENQPEGCADVPPTDELCDGYFMRWFYDADTNACTEIGYSGCGGHGFYTQEECEACLCVE